MAGAEAGGQERLHLPQHLRRVLALVPHLGQGQGFTPFRTKKIKKMLILRNSLVRGGMATLRRVQVEE